MRSITRPLTGIALLALFFLTWGAKTDRDVVGAQTRKPQACSFAGNHLGISAIGTSVFVTKIGWSPVASN